MEDNDDADKKESLCKCGVIHRLFTAEEELEFIKGLETDIASVLEQRLMGVSQEIKPHALLVIIWRLMSIVADSEIKLGMTLEESVGRYADIFADSSNINMLIFGVPISIEENPDDNTN